MSPGHFPHAQVRSKTCIRAHELPGLKRRGADAFRLNLESLLYPWKRRWAVAMLAPSPKHNLSIIAQEK